MKSFLALLALAAALLGSVDASPEMSKKLLMKLSYHSLMGQCWGEKNTMEYYGYLSKTIDTCLKEPESLQLFPDATPLRRRRELSPEGVAHFREELGEMKEDLTARMSNLTCVLRRMRYLDENNMVNMDFLLNGMWEEYNTGNMDPAVVSAMKAGIQDCHDYASAIPQSLMDKSPVHKKLGRQLAFQKCRAKSEIKICAQHQMSNMLEAMYGEYTNEVANDLGLPEDKLESSLIAFKVRDFMTHPVKKFVKDMMFGFPHKK